MQVQVNFRLEDNVKAAAQEIAGNGKFSEWLRDLVIKAVKDQKPDFEM